MFTFCVPPATADYHGTVPATICIPCRQASNRGKDSLAALLPRPIRPRAHHAPFVQSPLKSHLFTPVTSIAHRIDALAYKANRSTYEGLVHRDTGISSSLITETPNHFLVTTYRSRALYLRERGCEMYGGMDGLMGLSLLLYFYEAGATMVVAQDGLQNVTRFV